MNDDFPNLDLEDRLKPKSAAPIACTGAGHPL